MKVTALCNIIYGGELYSAGDVFEADKLLPNTEPADDETEQDEPITPESEETPPEPRTRKRR